ncbi:MAG: trypsin-like peptidase domain-containing protein [Ktedonobacterales bacterium]|nr:trypsin-like peptidase domain-containing protein [Ktedonobacterales bacterium]
MTATDMAADYSDALAVLAARLREGVVQIQTGGHGIGSGIIWRTGVPDATGEVEATIITNAHVVRATGDRALTLRLTDGREVRAEVVAVDPERDLAALRARTSRAHALEIGDSSALRVGELVLAVGNPFGRLNSVTMGVVAARAPVDPNLAVEPAETPDRRTPDQSTPSPEPRAPRGRWQLPRLEVIQADVRLYPGNSGGPLTDAGGRVVGVNAMIGGGLAFAIPSRTVQQFLLEVERATERPHLGVQVLTVALPESLRQRLGLTQESAALVAVVEPGSAAEDAGLLVGDVLLAVNGLTVPSAEHLPRILARAGDAETPLTLTLARGGERLALALRPSERAAA